MNDFSYRCAAFLACCWGLMLGPAVNVCADESACAVVKMQIDQELTLTRQAFEGRMTIANGLPNALDEFTVTLVFYDDDGDVVDTLNTDDISKGNVSDEQIDNAYFVHRLYDAGDLQWNSSDSVYQQDTLSTGTTTFVFLMIPAPRAAVVAENSSDDESEGREYEVGAIITYKNLQQLETIEVVPDTIRVKPMPELGLDYFLPYYVYGDDPMTTVVEPLTPFSLGLRIRNVGAGDVYDLQVESGQPKIIENTLGLAIDFKILGTEVNGISQGGSLLADFGNIESGETGLARWTMTSSLSGEFTLLDVSVSHSDELGGEVTSLIDNEEVNTYTLLGEVLLGAVVQDEGENIAEDNVIDFLALAGQDGDPSSVIRSALGPDDAVYVYPSNAHEGLPVLHLDSESDPSGFITSGDLVISVRASVEDCNRVYIRTPDPHRGGLVVSKVVRNDGKVLPDTNAWLTKVSDDGNKAYYLHIFDSGVPEGSEYIVSFSSASEGNQHPEIDTLGDVIVLAGDNVSIGVRASDPDSDVLILSHGLLPYGATFSTSVVPDEDGKYSGTMTWTPTSDYAGRSYDIEFLASDGRLTARETLALHVVDAPSLLDAWSEHYGITDLGIDSDGDGFSNLLEYALGGDPTIPDLRNQPALSIVSDAGAEYLALGFMKRLGTTDPNLSYTLVAADNLQTPIANWAVGYAALPSESAASVPSGFERVLWRDVSAVDNLTSLSRRFVALKVSAVVDDTTLEAFSPVQGLVVVELPGQTESYVSLPFQREPAAMYAVAEIVDSGASAGVRIDSASMASASYAPYAEGGPYYLEMITGNAVGSRWSISGNSENQVYVEAGDGAALGSLGIMTGDIFQIRPDYTVEDVFASLLDPVSEDQWSSLILQGDALLFYADAWMEVNAPPEKAIQIVDHGTSDWLLRGDAGMEDRSRLALEWGAPFVVRREGTEGRALYLLGMVPTADWKQTIPASSGTGELLIGYGWAESQTLGDSGLSDVFAAASSANETSDQLLDYNNRRKGFYLPPETLLTPTATGWVFAGSGADAGDRGLQPGKAWRIRRRSPAEETVWAPPDPNQAQ